MNGIKYILDTNFIISIMKSDPRKLPMIKEFNIFASACASSVITRFELIKFNNITQNDDVLTRQKLSASQKVVGMKWLIIKVTLDNFRASSVQGIIKRINTKCIEIVVYEPALKEAEFFNSSVVNNLAQFKQKADVIVANRMTNDISDVADKVYSRDLFGKD
jgi:UDP-glucose 6-dehydrogenase